MPGWVKQAYPTNKQPFSEPAPQGNAGVAVDLTKEVRRFQTIDISALDRGRLGHRIPVELICNLSQNGRPSAEYRVVTWDRRPSYSGDATPTSVGEEVRNSSYLWIQPAPGTKLHLKGNRRMLRRSQDWTIK